MNTCLTIATINLPFYIMYLAKIESIITNHNANGVLILSNVNADVHGISDNELSRMCSNLELYLMCNSFQLLFTPT